MVVTIDGNSRRMDLLGYRLERDLPLVAEGCAAGAMGRTQRQRMGRGFVDLFLRGRHTGEEGPMVLRGVSETRWYYPPFEYECVGYPPLHARLRTTEEVIVAWSFQEVAPEVLLEELHTACELVLEERVNQRAKRLSFAELVAVAEGTGVFRKLEDEATPATVLLLALKDLRRDVRHRAAEGARAWLDVHWENVAMILERLVSDLNRRGSMEPSSRAASPASTGPAEAPSG